MQAWRMFPFIMHLVKQMSGFTSTEEPEEGDEEVSEDFISRFHLFSN
jgi:hypothetical protein